MRWVGGKQRLVHSLKNHLPPQGSYNAYFEPFLGAGSLFLAGDFSNAVLNDLNFHLINTYQQVRNRPEELHAQIQEHARMLRKDHRKNFANDWKNYTRKRGKESYYYKVRNEYNANLELPDDENHPDRLQQAARFLFLIHSNFNGLFRVNKQGGYNVPFGKKLTRVPELEHLQRISEKLQGARFTTCSFEELKPDIGADAFVYLDPPYPNAQPFDLFNQKERSIKTTFTSYNAPPFGIDEHELLADFANEIRERGAKVMVSIAEPYEAPDTDPRRMILRKWYPEQHWTYHGTEYKRTVGGKKDPQIVRELILTSYKTDGGQR